MIDSDGFRANVGIIICNKYGQVMWARRFGQHSWQFPQGGVDDGETPEQAMYRELYEEVGLKPENVQILTSTRSWLRYRLPKRLIRQESKPVCIGQKQKWYLLQLKDSDDTINLNSCGHPEFDDWRWVNYWYPVRQVVSFKRDVYRKVMKEFSSITLAFQGREPSRKRGRYRN
ncbi:RNA pyrophosphohydrolase [Shewanella sp. 10N.286.52.B9]|uniref:RNA pyrophosphohydrolase n=1 Tax=Shewanella sp. 10N.286.52.B9 TaxID=1880837 RepID=UPI000C8289B1|nr:RNA pyrophosphohydrolase [Shewanella sp. 10N.286.52.B9]PMG43144.1 RNA pyrophosphohydrolase [Shewanella sp. 10N.286.52.B9]